MQRLTALAIVTAATLYVASAIAQETFTPNDISDPRAGMVALSGATVTVAPGQVVEEATILIRDGRIVSVESGGIVPDGYVSYDVSGRYIYPSLIDIYTSYGMPQPPERTPFSWSNPQVLESQTPGAFNANEAIKTEYSAVSQFDVNDEAAATWRSMGFGAVMSFMPDGIARGSSTLVSTGEMSSNDAVLVPEAAAMYSFAKGSSRQTFPSSPMGAIALLRQTFLDSQWYDGVEPKPFTDESLARWSELQSLPQVFETRSWLEMLRADKTGDEFDVQYIIKGNGDSYQRVDAIKATGAPLIVPVSFPDAENVQDPFDAERVTLAALKHWELAPSNLAILESADIEFAITSGNGAKLFWKNLRAAIERGLSEDRALAALTTVPAKLLGQQSRLGVIQAGADANLLVTSGPLFDEERMIEEHWVAGERYVIEAPAKDRSGVYALLIGDRSFELIVSGKPASPKAKVLPAGMVESDEDDKAGKGAKLSFDDSDVSLVFPPEPDAPVIRLAGWAVNDNWSGKATLPDGSIVPWTAVRAGDAPEPEKKDEEEEAAADDELGPVIYPFTAYGQETAPAAETLLIRGATVWTLEGEGKIEGADVLVRDGRIAAVGQNLEAAGARIIDGTGKHLTPGMVDEHSHIALSGVNDIATNSAMVRMKDVVDSEDVNIYRNLAGGVTTSQLLHGSANPVGGQSAIIKMRWGSLPDEMLFEGADKFIKFALGENVKRSRNPASIRYPRSRMGVEQVFRDSFTRALEYEAEWDAWRNLSRRERARTPAPRRDLVMDAMVEVINSERHITCHSYVQSEINMLMHVADDFGFNVNTFTHILEGYKVADKMAAHGAGASTFADWWGFKWEVRYAIPYNPSLMQQAGVVVSVNSDDAEMARRLNQEAAKSIKYGDMDEVSALKMVTLNPAKLLRLDDRIGSIRAGKDADLVIWSDNPLSIDARVETTIVDGIVMFDLEDNARRHEALQAERSRLIEKMRKSGGGSGGGNGPSPARFWHCDSVHGYEYLFERTGHHHH